MTALNRTIPATSFGSVHFHILWGNSVLSMSDFEYSWITNTRHVPNSDRVITHLMGKGPGTATYRLEFDSLADFAAMETKVQTTDTLTLIYGMTTAAGTYQRIVDEDCLLIAGVTLLSLANRAVFVGGDVQADATFLLASP